MPSNSETNNNTSPKRVRIEDPIPSTTDISNAKMKTPKALALACIGGHVESLHPQVAKIVKSYAEKHVNLFTKLEQKKLQVDKMSKDADFIPRSARINFEFYVRPQIQDSTEFTEIKEETAKMISDFQKNLKSQIVCVTIMEVNLLKKEIDDNSIRLIHHTTNAFHLQNNPDRINHTVTATIAHIINGYGPTMLRYTTMDKDGFKRRYAELFNDNSIQNYNSGGSVTNADNPNNPYSQRTILSQNNTYLPSHLGEAVNFIDSLRNTLETVLLTSIDNYTNQVLSNKIASTLEAYGHEVLLETTTSETTEMMDLSKSVAPEELQELVKKSTDSAISSLTKEIQSLRDKLNNSKSNQKNSKGRGKPSASLKKKSKKGDASASKSNQPNTNKSNNKPRKSTIREKHDKGSEKDSRGRNTTKEKKKTKKNRRRSPSNNNRN